MKKRSGVTLMLMAVLLAVLMIYGCDKGSSPTAPPAVSAPVTSSTVSSSTPEPEPVAEASPDPCEGDASCGRSVSMEFEGTTLNISSTMHGPRQGEVCITDGFQGPLAGYYPWTVAGTGGAAGPVTNSVPFTIKGATWVNDFVTAEWPEGVCERTFNPQFDAIRNSCQSGEWGKLLAVIFPQHAEPITLTREPGEWVWTKEVRTLEEDWSECMAREDLPPELDQSEIPEYDVGPNGPVLACVKYRKVTVVKTATRSCSVDTQRAERSFIEWERCECPCKVPAALETSLDHNRNDIWTEATVEGEGAWELKIFASNRAGEYPDDPDWTKRTVRLTLDCEEVPGPETMRASFRWRGHGAPYWWAALYVDGQRVWLSRRVRK